MNKLAAEKSAQEYYQAGLELALVKEAGLPKEIIKKLLQMPSAGLGGLAGGGLGMKALGLGMDSSISNPEVLALLMASGGGAMLGAKGAGKAVDLAHSGGSKLLNKLRR